MFEARIPSTDTTVQQHPKDDFGSVPTNAAQAAQAVRDPSGTFGANATVKRGDGTVQSGQEAMVESREKPRDQA